MNLWTEIADKFERVDTKDLLARLILTVEDVLLNINKQTQLYQRGQLSDGSFLPPYRNFTVMAKRNDPNADKRTENMTLKNYGDFYEGFKMQVTSDEVIIYSTDRKTDDLVARYGREIFGLTDENWEKASEVFLEPQLIQLIDNEL